MLRLVLVRISSIAARTRARTWSVSAVLSGGAGSSSSAAAAAAALDAGGEAAGGAATAAARAWEGFRPPHAAHARKEATLMSVPAPRNTQDMRNNQTAAGRSACTHRLDTSTDRGRHRRQRRGQRGPFPLALKTNKLRF